MFGMSGYHPSPLPAPNFKQAVSNSFTSWSGPDHGSNPTLWTGSGLPRYSPFNYDNQRFRRQSNESANHSYVCNVITKGEYSCETCDRHFKVKEKYEEHVSEHIKCHVEGCKYIAASKLVELHYRLQHRTGLADKIMKLETEDDIKKWIEERKRNFPTINNIAKKEQLEKEKEERGEVLHAKTFGKMRNRMDHRRGQRFHPSDRFPQQRNGDNWNRQPPQQPQTKQAPPPRQAAVAVKTERTTPNKTVEKKASADTVQTNGSLGILAACYASETEEGEITDSDDETKPPPPSVASSQASTQPKEEKSPQPLPPNSSIATANKRGRGRPFPARRNRKSRPKDKPRAAHPKSSLLEKLLADEIRHERNIVLQCLRFIVTNNFFEEHV